MTIRKFRLASIDPKLIDPPKCNRRINNELVQRLVPSIVAFGGLFQRIGVIELKNGRFRLVWGNHRLRAVLLALMETIDVMLLPDDVTEADELAYSIQENALRREEHFEDVLKRVEHHARVCGLSMRKSAEQNGVAPGSISQIRKVKDTLHPEAQKLALEHKTGVTVLYAISSAPKEDHVAYLKANIKGELSRDEIVSRIKTAKQPKQKKVTLAATVAGLPVQLSVPEDCGYERLGIVLSDFRKLVVERQKQGLDFALLPKVLK